MSTRAGRALGSAARVVVQPGPGVVHRGPDVLLVLPVIGPDQVGAARELLATCDVADDPTGRRRARRVAALVASTEEPDAVPDFALVLDVDAGPVLLLYGDVDALVRGRAEERVDGRASLAWVEHRVDPDFTELRLGGPGAGVGAEGGADGHGTDGGGAADPSAGLPLDLTLGTVPGSGVTVLRTLAATDAAPPVEQVPAPPAARAEPAPARGRAREPERPAEPEEPAVEEPMAEERAVEEPKPEVPVAKESRAKESPAEEPVTGPVTEPVPQPVPEPSPEALAEATPEVTAEPVAEPVAEGATRRDPSVAAQFTVMRPVTRFRNVPLSGVAAPVRAPLPLAGETPDRTEAPTVDRQVVVEGLPCPAGHLNDPRSATCVLCGRPIDRESPPVRAARPPLGVLVTDEGSVFLLTSDVVIGREPGRAEDVIAGRAQQLPLRDEAHSVSRVHAHVRLDGWEVTVADSGSSNGTFLSSHGAAGPWVPVEEPTVLSPGDRIRLGKRHLMFDRHPAAVGRPAGPAAAPAPDPEPAPGAGS